MKLCDPFRWGQNYWQVAQFLRFGLKRPEEAVLWYEKVIAEAPGTAMVLSARKELAQLREGNGGGPRRCRTSLERNGSGEIGAKPDPP